ncbi:MAG: energy-coupling factor ABC transporter ATP-binding protein [Bacilli bacterium]|nr:energy-coupling factor ABC transporter ATP-binding protein [Bacilli bacterium]
MEIIYNNVSYTHNAKTVLKTNVFENLNMKIEAGLITAIVGKSGTGKTTLLEMLNALIIPSTGSIKVGKWTINKKTSIKDINELRKNIGLVFETPEIQFFNITVKDELLFAMKCFNYQLDKSEKRIKQVLLMVGLDESYLNRDPYTLSNGEKRKIALASILTYNPKIIALDEPTVGLDEVSKKNLIKILNLLKNKYHKTIIVVSQDVDFLHNFVDYVHVINDKKVILSGNKYEVFTNVNLLNEAGINVPKVIDFSYQVLQKKQIKLGYRDQINDLIKDVYRCAR